MNDYNDLVKIVESSGFLNVIGDSQIASVQCLQFGDTGKGKIVALLALWADFTARGTGTSNAGHTSYIKHLDQLIKVITHYIPSSIFYDHLGKVSILGSGMGINLEELLGEMDSLTKAGITFNNMMISKDASLILPYHVMKDRGNKSMKPGSASSTGKGTTPVYSDRIARLGIFYRDLFNVDTFVKKLRKAQNEYSQFEFCIDEVVGKHREMFERVKDMIRDTKAYTHAQLAQGKRMAIEGAQGTLLSILFGTYGYCTSSDPSVYGSAFGCDIKPEDIDLILGLVKFPVMTRVGNGPFPSEFGGRRSEEYCAEDDGNAHKKKKEEESFSSSTPHAMITCKDEFLAGIGWRRAMGEYGATTARPRRTGRVDAVAGRYAVELNSGNSKYLPGPHNRSKRRVVLVSTKSDCAAGMGDIEICTGYEHIETGEKVAGFTPDSEELYKLQGIYETFPGFEGDVQGIQRYEELPPELRNLHEKFEGMVGAKFGMISTGPRTEDIVFVPNH